MIEDHSIMSVKEARKILGQSAESMSDLQIEDLIANLHSIAKLTIREIIEGRIKISD